MLQGISPLESWKENLRLTRNQLFNLTKELQPYISPSLLSPNHSALNADKNLALTLYYLEDTGSLIMTAINFRVAINTASSVIYEVCLAICQILGPQYIGLPKTKEEMREKIFEFESKFGIVQALGVLMSASCTHQVSSGKFIGLYLLRAVLFIKCTGFVRL